MATAILAAKSEHNEFKSYQGFRLVAMLRTVDKDGQEYKKKSWLKTGTCAARCISMCALF
jgi:hypothetical protein